MNVLFYICRILYGWLVIWDIFFYMNFMYRVYLVFE